MTVAARILFVITLVQVGTVVGYPVQSVWHNLAMQSKSIIEAPQLPLRPYRRHSHHNCISRLTDTNVRRGVGDFLRKTAALLLLCPILLGGTMHANGDDELARYAAEGNKVGVDTQCFFRKCAVETAKCANDPNCLKGLACLSRCKGGSMCSTGCFAKYGSKQLDEILSCTVDRNDCVQVPGKETTRGWGVDTAGSLPAEPLSFFDIASLEGGWFKVMGLDSRYDCFDCQKNTFAKRDKNTLLMEALFRIPRPTEPGYMQNKIEEELFVPPKPAEPSNGGSAGGVVVARPHLQSKGEMFGLTFWENWYVLGESPATSTEYKGALVAHAAGAAQDSPVSDMKLIYYTGHTLQGSYKGAFLYSRSAEMTPTTIRAAMEVITKAGLNPADFCMIRNQCFSQKAGPARQRTASTGYVSGLESSSPSTQTQGGGDTEETVLFASAGTSKPKYVGYDTPFWFLRQNFFRATSAVATELADWFQDPALLSEWLVKQQVRMVLQHPMEVSPFAELPDTTR